MSSRTAIKHLLRVGLDAASLITRGLSRKESARILNYHEILADAVPLPNPFNQVRAGSLASHVDALLAAGYKLVTVSRLTELMKEPGESLSKLIALTFDDGLVEHHSRVLPILVERKVPATFYVLPGRTGQPPYMGSKEGRHLTREEIGALVGAGMEIGSHSRSHPVLSRLDVPQLQDEIEGSAADIEGLTGARPRSFAYPYGSKRTYNSGVIDVVRNAGYENAVCTSIGGNNTRTPPFELKRITVYGTDSPARVLARAAGADDWLGGMQEAWLKTFPHHSTAPQEKGG